MRRTFYRLILVLLLLVVADQRPALAQQVMIVQSSPLDAYQQAVASFKQALNAAQALPGLAPIQVSQTLLLDPAAAIQGNTHRVTKKYQELRPDLVMAVGGLALEAVKDLSCSIMYIMVLTPDAIVGKRPNLAGIIMQTAPDSQLAAIKRTFPTVTTIALLHNPTTSGDFVSLAQTAAKRLGLTLIEAPADNSRAAIKLMSGMESIIDAIWLTPDPSIISPTMLNALALVSLEKRVPIIAFAPKYLEQGAAMTIFTSPDSLGRQAAEMVRKLIAAPTSIGVLKPEYGREATILTNGRIILKLGLIATQTPNAAGNTSP